MTLAAPGALSPLLTPQGQLRTSLDAEAPALSDTLAARLQAAFARGSGQGLLQLGATEVATPLPLAWGWWR